MKKFSKYLAVILACSFVFAACGENPNVEQVVESEATETVEEDQSALVAVADFEVQVNGDKVTVTKYTGTDETVEIPAEIDGLPVTEIGESCFAGNIHVKKVKVPEGVTAISDYAFECCSHLEKIYLPESLLKIGTGAFSGCGFLKLVDMQDNVEEIGDGAFLFCRKLVSFEAPSHLKELGAFALAGCEGIYTIDLSKSSIPAIKGRTFYRNARLTYISLPETVESVGIRAFAECIALANVYLPNVSLVESYAFEHCDALRGANIPKGEVKAYAFYANNELTNVNLDSGDIILRENAFAGSGVRMDNMYIPEGVTIEDNAFPYFPDEAEEMTEEEYLASIGEASDENEGEDAGAEEMTEEEYLASIGVSLDEVSEDGFDSAEEPVDEMTIKPDWDNIKTIDEILAAATEAGYKAISNDEFDSWAEGYLDFNKDTALFTKEENVYITMYKGQIEGYFQAMNATATRDPLDLEQAYEKHGDDFYDMYEVVNHGLRTEMARFKIEDDLVLMTGIYPTQLKFAAGTDEVPTMEQVKERIGSTFTDPSLTSTTTDYEVALDFSDTMFIIYAPAKSINAVGSVCMDAYLTTGEKEILLDSNTEYEILDVGYFTFDKENYAKGITETAYEKYVLLQLLNE